MHVYVCNESLRYLLKIMIVGPLNAHLRLHVVREWSSRVSLGFLLLLVSFFKSCTFFVAATAFVIVDYVEADNFCCYGIFFKFKYYTVYIYLLLAFLFQELKFMALNDFSFKSNTKETASFLVSFFFFEV